MANQKISALNSLTKSTVATNDVLPIVDTGSTETKKITYQELIQPTDANFRIAGSADNTKLVAFEVDGLTTATTRTITIPDADLTMVGTATTQTLTNKTLTSPQINFGSDATGDLIYRNGSGVTARLPIGTTDQILAVQSGVPTWIANPSASAASSTTAGIVELATTAETETGTDATRAVTPDGLHDMTTLAGKAWFLDEDTMSSNSDTKTASQQSIKAYVDNSNLFAQGQTTATGTGNVTIAHGLGKTPKLVKITAMGTAVSNPRSSFSVGTATSTSNESCIIFAPQSTTNSSGNIIYVDSGTGSEEMVASLSTLDSTNIVINFGTFNGGGTCYIQWEAYA